MGKEIKFQCLCCGKSHVSVNKYSCKGKFCSQQCQHDFQMDQTVLSGKAKPRTLKKYLLKKHGNKCWTCGIVDWNDKPIVLDLEHIDGDSENNSLENLSLICPNCHSQTPTYKNRNRGKGRHSRRTRYKEGKSY